jgi:hypothetical protein
MNQPSEMEIFTWMSPTAVTCLEADSRREAATQTTMHNSPIEKSMPALAVFEVPGGSSFHIGCPISGVTQRAMREAAPHARGMSKARQL